MAPSRGAQVYYNSSPPEAIVDNSLEDASDLNSEKEASSTRKPRKILIFTVLAAVLLVTISLGVGLGIGLRQQEKDITPSASPDFPRYITPFFFRARV